MSGLPLLISGQHLRFAIYVALSAVSGVAWVGTLLFWAGPNRDTPSVLFFLSGAVSGLLVGLLMNRIYRAEDWRYTIYCAPLALWLGVFLFGALVSLFNGNYLGILGAAAAATLMIFPPYLFLMLFAMINGLLLRWVVCCGTDDW